MTARFEEALKKLSPQQIETLLTEAEAMARQPRARGQKLRVDWGGCIDSEHDDGLEAQQAAIRELTDALDRAK